MALTSFSGGQDAFAPFWNPTRDVAHGTGKSGRDMHLDVMEVNLLCTHKIVVRGVGTQLSRLVSATVREHI